MVKCVELIIVEVTRGSGIPEDKYREVVQLWTKDGMLVSEADPCAPNHRLCNYETMRELCLK